MEPKDSQLPKPIKWTVNSEPLAKRVSYTSSTGHVITRKAIYGVKKAKPSGYRYYLSNADGSITGIPQNYHTTLNSAKAHVEEITRGKD